LALLILTKSQVFLLVECNCAKGCDRSRDIRYNHLVLYQTLT